MDLFESSMGVQVKRELAGSPRNSSELRFPSKDEDHCCRRQDRAASLTALIRPQEVRYVDGMAGINLPLT